MLQQLERQHIHDEPDKVRSVSEKAFLDSSRTVPVFPMQTLEKSCHGDDRVSRRVGYPRL